MRGDTHMRKNKIISMVLTVLLFFSFANIQTLIAEDVTKDGKIEKKCKRH